MHLKEACIDGMFEVSSTGELCCFGLESPKMSGIVTRHLLVAGEGTLLDFGQFADDEHWTESGSVAW